MATENNPQSTLLEVQKVMSDLPLESILTTAESIAESIPALGKPLSYVIKALKFLIKSRNTANGFLNTGVRVLNAVTGNTDSTPTNENIEENHSEANQAEIIDKMIEIAIEDGELSPEEEHHLINNMIKEAGYSEAEANQVISDIREYLK